MYSGYVDKIIADYKLTEEDLVYNNKPKFYSWIYAYVTKDTLAEMMKDSRLEAFSVFDMSPVTNF